MYKPVKYKKSYPVQRTNQSNNIINFNPQHLSSFFSKKVPSGALKNGRINCQTILTTAILTDAHGNKMVLKEHHTSMNFDKDFRGQVKYIDGRNGFKHSH